MSKYADDHTYHVYNRGAHRSSIFRRPAHYHKCVDMLNKYSSKYGVTLVAYCLMPNHYHLLVRQEVGGSISRYLQTTFNAYVQYFNTLEKHSGTLFQGAAKSKCVETDEQLMQCVTYIHTNPVRASLVQKVNDWEYSDYSVWKKSVVERGESYEGLVAAYLGAKDSEDPLWR